MNQRDFLLTKINSGKAELEQMPAFMQMEREYLQADIKEWEEELAKIPPGPNGEKIYFLNRQINAAKDYLRRLHPRFEEERKHREKFIQEKEAELKELGKENGAKTPQLEPCPFCGSMPKIDNRTIWCDWQECYVRPNIYCEMPEFLPKLWNQMATIESECEKPESQKETNKMSGPFKPCAKCGSPVEWSMSLSGRRGWVKCPRCGNEMTVDDEEYHTMEEWVEMWNKVNTKPETQIPPKFSQVMKEIGQRIPVNMLNKLYLLNSILGLQRDEKGPVIEVKKIQETILEIDQTIQKREIWQNDEAISELGKQCEEMKSDEYLAPSENRKIAVHGSVYVTALHIAGAVCREAEMYAWEYEQKHGIEELSQVCKYLDQLAEWLFVRAEYLRETEECF